MTLQEHIRRVLREETKKLPTFILRRMDFNEVKNILDKEIEKHRHILSQIRYKALMKYITDPDSSKYVVDHIFRETTRKVLPIDIHQTYYGELLDYLRAEYYDYVFNKIKEYQLFYLKQKYKNK